MPARLCHVRPPLALVAAIAISAAAGILAALPGTRAAQNNNESKETGPMFAHMVFFDLKQNTAEDRDQLVDACYKYLKDHPGVVHFSAGTRATEYTRDVNDTKFDVSLHVVFEDQASHDAYQTAPSHLKFIEENKELWAGVRVFDSFVR